MLSLYVIEFSLTSPTASVFDKVILLIFSAERLMLDAVIARVPNTRGMLWSEAMRIGTYIERGSWFDFCDFFYRLQFCSSPGLLY